MSDRLTLKGWCDWLIRDLAYRAPELWPAAIEQWVAKTVRDYSPPEEQWVVVEVIDIADTIRVYSGPEPMDKAAAFRLHRQLSRGASSMARKYYCRKIQLGNPDEHRGTDPQ